MNSHWLKSFVVGLTAFCLAGVGCSSDESGGNPPVGTDAVSDSSTGTDGTSETDGTTSTDGTSSTDGTDGTDSTTLVCTADESFCNGKSLFTCNSSGTKLSQTECTEGCTGGECVAACTANSAVCAGDQLIECDAAGKETVTICQEGCEAGACNTLTEVCTPNELLCEPNSKKILICAEDGLSASTHKNCPFGCTEGETACGTAACAVGETRCAADEPTFVEICLADQSGWKKAESACKNSCKDGECFVPNCTPDEEQCGVTGIEKCDAGGVAFNVIELCKSGCVNTPDGPACAKCVEGLKQCNGNAIESCNDSTVGFVTTQTCDGIQACVAGQCVNVLVLDGAVSTEDNLLKVMLAFVDCFTAKIEGSCRSINASAVSDNITASQIKTWFCDNKDDETFQVKFGSEAKFEAALDIAGCGTFNVEDMTFETGQITGGLTGTECIGFDAGGILSVNDNEVIVDLCVNFEVSE